MDNTQKKISRIDIVGSNGNDGLHYNEAEQKSNSMHQALLNKPTEEEFLNKLVDDHWKYIEGIFMAQDRDDDLVHEIGYHYKTAMKHGWRHAKEYFTGNV